MSNAQYDTGGITLIGTVHVSPESTTRVHETLTRENPDVIAVEIDSPRLAEYRNPTPTKQKYRAALSSGVSPAQLVSSAAFAYLSRKLDQSFDIDPGAADMIPAIEHGHNTNTPVALIDPVSYDVDTNIGRALPRDITRFLSLYVNHRFRNKHNDWSDLLKTLSTIAPTGLNGSTEDTLSFLEEMTYEELDRLLHSLERVFPTTYEYMLTERNKRIAGRLLWLSMHGYDTVAVLGKAHVTGVSRLLNLEERGHLDPTYITQPEYDSPPQ